jgi:hypothetical protein
MDEKIQKKYLLLKVGVISLAILILALWAFNLKNVWLADQKLAPSENNEEWADLKTSLDKTLVNVKSQVDNIQKTKEAAKKTADQALLTGLLEETEKRASAIASSTVATSSATSSNVTATTTPSPVGSTNNCPEYIDCMPTIGATRPCQIPVGCEGITQIAY